jgi:hypothetical protein
VNRVAPQTLSASLERCWSLIYDSNSSNVQRSMAKNLLYSTPPHSRAPCGSCSVCAHPNLLYTGDADISLGPWVPDSEPGLMTRVVKYTKPMQSAFVKVRTHLSFFLDYSGPTHIFSTLHIRRATHWSSRHKRSSC